MTASALLEGLNPQQRQAVVHTGGPVLVVAGAGSGKTRVLTRRIAYLLAEGEALPHQILAITFTNQPPARCASASTSWSGMSRGMWVLTFHATCGRILRRDADRLGYRSNFTIYDQADQVRLVRSCLEELDRDPKRFPPRGVHSRISAEKNRLVSAAEFKEQVAGFFEQTVADVFELYEQRLHQSNAMDFDDLLVRTVDLLERFDDVRERWQERLHASADRRVPGHESRPVPHRDAALREAPQSLRGRRLRPVGVRVPRRRHPQHPRLRARLRGRRGDPARAELPLDPDGSSTPRTPSSRTTRTGSRSGSGPTSATASPCA